MPDLVVFLRARLDEDEAIARAVPQFAWWVDGASVRTEGDRIAILAKPSRLGYDEAEHRAAALHAVRHDPARVLAEVAAKRAIVALHGERDGECMSCAYGGGFSVRYDDHPCDTLRHLAAVYAGHVDYRAEWAPADVGVEG